MTSENCQVCGKAKSDCQGHDNPASSKQRLDAIRTAGAQRAPVVTEEPTAGLSLKEQLDAIPAPAAGDSAAGGAGLGLKKQGDATSNILGRKTGDIGNLKGALDSIPTPGAGAAAPGLSKDVLDSIPTPGTGAAAALGGAGLADLDSIPTPNIPASPPKPQGEVPQWMKNFEQHQSSLTGGQPGGVTPQYGSPQGGYGVPAAPDSVPSSYGMSRGGDAPPPQGSTYNMIIGIVVIICIVIFGYIMIAKPEPAKFPDADTTTPASTSPSTPTSTPAPTPTPTPAPTVTPTVPINSTPVPGAPQGMPTPMPAPGTPDPTAVPTTVPSTYPGNNPVTAPQGNNPVPVTPGNNP